MLLSALLHNLVFIKFVPWLLATRFFDAPPLWAGASIELLITSARTTDASSHMSCRVRLRKMRVQQEELHDADIDLFVEGAS